MKHILSLPWLAGREAKQLDTEMDQRLRAGVTPPQEPPPWLHASVMNGVRDQAGAAPATPRLRLAWALPVAAAALLAGWFLLRPTDPLTGRLASEEIPALMLSEVTWQSAAVAVQPLDDELTNLTRDLKRTQEFVLASLP